MEQRVRDLIESLQKFDPDLRVSEKTTLNFKCDGYATRLVVECNNTDYEAKIAELHEANAKLEGIIEDKDENIDGLNDDISHLNTKISDLEYDLDECRKSLDVIRGAL